MSAKIAMLVLESGLAHRLKLTAVAMALHADEDGGRIFPSIGRVARLVGKTSRRIRDDVTALCGLGVLEPIGDGGRRGGKGRSTVYRLNLESLKGGHQRPPYNGSNADAGVHVIAPNADAVVRVFISKGGRSGHERRTLAAQTRTLAAPNADASVLRSSIDQSIDLPEKRTAAAPRFSEQAKAPNGNNFKPIVAVVWELLRDGITFDDLVEATKQRCAELAIDYGRHDAVPFDVVHRAVASVLSTHRLAQQQPSDPPRRPRHA
jgi:hypothetical protein